MVTLRRLHGNIPARNVPAYPLARTAARVPRPPVPISTIPITGTRTDSPLPRFKRWLRATSIERCGRRSGSPGQRGTRAGARSAHALREGECAFAVGGGRMDYRCIDPGDAAGRPPNEAGVKAYRSAPRPTPRLRGSLETPERMPGKWPRPRRLRSAVAPPCPRADACTGTRVPKPLLSSAATAYRPRSAVGPDTDPDPPQAQGGTTRPGSPRARAREVGRTPPPVGSRPATDDPSAGGRASAPAACPSERRQSFVVAKSPLRDTTRTAPPRSTTRFAMIASA